jgi:hypothetical protein
MCSLAAPASDAASVHEGDHDQDDEHAVVSWPGTVLVGRVMPGRDRPEGPAPQSSAMDRKRVSGRYGAAAISTSNRFEVKAFQAGPRRYGAQSAVASEVTPGVRG